MSCAANILRKKRTEQVGSHRARPQSTHKRDDVTPLTHLQKSAGNLALKSLLQSNGIRGKFAVSNPDDPVEREADRAADQVLSDQGTLVQKRVGSVAPTSATRSGRPMSDFGTGRPLDRTTLD